VAQELAGWKLIAAVLYREPALPPSAPLWASLGTIAEQECFSRISLVGLDPSGTAEYLRKAMLTNPPPALVQAVHQRTEGNLLFIAEVVTLLANEGLLQRASGTTSGSWMIHIPEKVRLAILGRLHRLSADCRDMLSAAAW
jgi:predicted ATPase